MVYCDLSEWMRSNLVMKILTFQVHNLSGESVGARNGVLMASSPALLGRHVKLMNLKAMKKFTYFIPASIKSTFQAGFSESRLASTLPPMPAPTITKS